MNAIWVILKKELYSYFLSPIAYIIFAVFLFYNGYTFSFILSILSQPLGVTGSPMSLFFGQTIFFWLVVLSACSLISMRTITEERRSGTLEMLMTAPVTDLQVVLGKFLSAWLFYILLWVPTLLYPLILEWYSDPDWGPIKAGYLGTVLLGAFLISIGVFTSTLTRNQIIAAVLSFVIMGMLFVIGLMEYVAPTSRVKDIFAFMNLWSHMEDFGKGIVDTRWIVYFLSGTLLGVFAAWKTFQLKRLSS